MHHKFNYLRLNNVNVYYTSTPFSDPPQYTISVTPGFSILLPPMTGSHLVPYESGPNPLSSFSLISF